MFPILFSKATEPFGKSFILSSSFPCWICFLSVGYIMVPRGCASFFNMLRQKPKTGPIAETIAFLFLIDLSSYVIYSVRDSILYLLRSPSVD